MKSKLSTSFWWFVVIGMAVLMIIGLFSCNPAQRAAKRMNWAYKHDRAMVARFTRDSFPCIDKPVDSAVRYVPGKKDTVTDWQYIFLKDNDGRIDTVLAPCKCPVADPDTVYYDINHRVLDSAALRLLQDTIKDLRAKNIQLSGNAEQLKKEGKAPKWIYWVAGLGVLGTVILGFIGSKGGWVVALIKLVPKIIQLFKKKQ